MAYGFRFNSRVDHRWTWDRKFTLWPQRCCISAQTIWPGWHWRLTRIVGGVGGVFVDHEWVHLDVGTGILLSWRSSYPGQ